ncbi:MAG: hypothetical protein CMH83_18965 [Nocardioides sp.]|nr:hypothetical protein [Nocardioides sp.]
MATLSQPDRQPDQPDQPDHADGWAARFSPTPVDDAASAGIWWPRSRVLADELGSLYPVWPHARGRIVRVLYSPPDWDDRPRAVPVPGGRVKTGCFPRDDTRLLVLTTHDGERHRVEVLSPGLSEREAVGRLADAASGRVEPSA